MYCASPRSSGLHHPWGAQEQNLEFDSYWEYDETQGNHRIFKYIPNTVTEMDLKQGTQVLARTELLWLVEYHVLWRYPRLV